MNSTLIHNPDVLECLANLSSDEVFTPPKVVNDMLDMLPQNLFASTTTKFLDPCCKSGIFLREIAKRLIAGTRDQYDSLQSCVNHIFHKQLFGIAITELTSLMSRRSLYCSKDPSCPYSASHFESVEGNIRFKSIQHAWNKGKCRFCGASESEYKRGNDKESHAYEFIHCANMRDLQNELFKTEYPDTNQEKDMHFDVIIGNPPYQLDTAGAGKQAKPIYDQFVMSALKLNPKYLVMITPSRWLSGGMGLSKYRDFMLKNKHLKQIRDYSLSKTCFPGVDIAGGVSYFIHDLSYNNIECEYTYIDGDSMNTKMRILNEFDVFVRDNRAIDIVRKVVKNDKFKCINELMSSLGVFGLSTSERGNANSDDSYGLLSSAGRSYIKKNKVTSGKEYIPFWKVIIGKATSAGAATANKEGQRKVIATIDILKPNEVCTFSYFIGGKFDNEDTAVNYKRYLCTKFVRFLLLQTLSSIDITKDRFIFVPIQDFSKPWTDAELYEKYGLSQEEIDFIESMIKSME